MKLNHRISKVGKESLKLSSPTISSGPLCSALNFLSMWHIFLNIFMDSIAIVSLGSMFPCCYSILESLVKKFSSEMEKPWQKVLATNQEKTQIPERERAKIVPCGIQQTILYV